MPTVPKPNFKRKSPKRGLRGEFNMNTKKKVYERDNELCQNCYRKGEEIHHVLFKSRGGRGTYSNGLTLCNSCHREIHMDAGLTNYWIRVFVQKYGPDFYKDDYD